MTAIAHVVNPVQVKESSDLFVAQPITFETMRVARDFAAGQVDVGLFSAQYPEDHPVVPADFQRTPDLETSILDYSTFQRPRKLPLLKEILDRLYQASDAEYMVYTNVDIGLLPHFYLAVDRFIAAGYDAFVVNRRTISCRYQRVDQIPLMYGEVGEPHRGWDCFVFRRAAYASYELGTVCLGAPRMGLALVANLVAHAERFHEFKDQHLTFHLGNDRSWGRSPYADYAAHNARQALHVLNELERKAGPFPANSPPGAFLKRRRRWGGLYEWWVRRVHLPVPTAQRLRRLFGQERDDDE
ncbi:MAG: hypothetical protein JW900_03005 [Anaerolineae bacterium]|nr:hypothetical protein [Anaerolineae bacterium]